MQYIVKTVVCVMATLGAAAAVLPAAYRELDFIQCDGASYLDTGIHATSNTAMTLDLSLPAISSSFYLLGQQLALTLRPWRTSSGTEPPRCVPRPPSRIA